MFDAFFPADLARGRLVERSYPDGGCLRYPELSAEQTIECCVRLRGAGERLRSRPVQHIVHALDRAAARLGDPASDQHRLALEWIPRTTGYSPEMAALVLRNMCDDWRAPALDRLLRAELGTPDCLDGFVAGKDAQRRVFALGPELTAHIFAGNVPGVAVTSLVRALLLKSPSFGKTAADEPVLPVLFANALASVDPELAAAIHVTYWPGGSGTLEATLLSRAEAVVVYGGDDAVRSIQQHMAPGQRLVVHGPRLSLGIVGPAAILEKTARDVARAVAVFDQQGCVSPHAVYVISPTPDAAPAFAQLVAARFREIAAELPRGRLTPGEAAAIQDARAHAEFRAIDGHRVQVMAGADLSYTVIYDADPAFQRSCLNRVLFVKPAESISQVMALLSPHRRFLQSVALEGFAGNDAADLARRLGSGGATRITSFAALPWPPAEWHHDGNGPLCELIRWVDWESA